MGTPEETTSKPPCHNRIRDNILGMLGFSVVTGSPYYFINGIYNSPAGTRLSGGAQAVGMNVPGLAGRFAVWGGLFQTVECALEYTRKKEDRWNTILSATAASGLLQLMRGKGIAASARSTVFSGAFMALLQGAEMIVFDKVKSAHERNEPSTSQTAGQSIPETSFASEVGSNSESRCGGLFEKFRFRRAETA